MEGIRIGIRILSNSFKSSDTQLRIEMAGIVQSSSRAGIPGEIYPRSPEMVIVVVDLLMAFVISSMISQSVKREIAKRTLESKMRLIRVVLFMWFSKAVLYHVDGGMPVWGTHFASGFDSHECPQLSKGNPMIDGGIPRKCRAG